VRCNPAIKFGALLRAARDLGAAGLATGHHARLDRSGGAPVLRRGRDAHKDQAYFLARLDRARLDFARFPIGELTKAEVRREAAARGLPTASRPESQDTCVAVDADVGREGGFAETLRRRFGGEARPGDVVDRAERVLGHHGGVHLFTLGQRRGLGVSLGRRAFVVGLDAPGRRVTVSTDPRDLEAATVVVSDVVWHVPPFAAPHPCLVQVRSRSAAVAATARRLDDASLLVDLHQAVTAVTPGQAAVLFDGDAVLAAGWIERAGARRDDRRGSRA
jgi:tRNA-specific 2-thiouridylase